ncbi:ABC transporter permease [Pelagerythrobacter marensis]|uniref:ABC transporter permease n=1 Tax=Pelagerythrobacter marensis TaxID=543877 RepID=A0A0G3XB39_9SPHN|nr:ABC transporter permease [Pelagerythrobacter marensis]AKM08417.1 ABC transporter permease [Pelagerythrobacter marensis]
MTAPLPANRSRLPLWRAAWVIARRDFTAILFSKAFLFFLIGPLFFIGISGAAGALSAQAVGNAQNPRLAVALSVAEGRAFAAAHARLTDLVRLPEIEVVDPAEADDPDGLLDDGERNFGAVLDGTLAEPRLIGTEERIEDWSGRVALIAAEASGAGAADYPPVALAPTAVTVASKRSANSATATAGLTLLFLLTMLLAGMVMSNLVEEKGNKIIEILAAAIPMDAVFFGKLFAMLAVSFVGIAIWGSAAGAIVVVTGALDGFAPPAVGWPAFGALFLAYFAMAYLLIGSIFLAIGSMAPTVRDVQTMSMPATILQLLVFFLASFAMTDIGSAVELFAVAFPLSSPYAMVARAAQEPALWPHALALAWQVLAVIAFVRFGARLFRRRVMKSGPAPARGGRALLARLARRR